MRFSASATQGLATPDGFDEGVVEKILHLVHLLDALNSHPSLKGKWVWKGGGASNLFVLRWDHLWRARMPILARNPVPPGIDDINAPTAKVPKVAGD